MKLRYTTYRPLVAIVLASLLGLYACKEERLEHFLRSNVKSPLATIERDVKGHEQIYKVQAILRAARKSTSSELYVAYDMGNVPPAFPLYQEIMVNKDDNGNMTITSSRKVFDVLKGQGVYYTLELRYYDINNAFINHQFTGFYPDDKDNSTLPVHQHFFTIQTYSLDGSQLTYPMTLDSIYIDKYLYERDEQGQRIESNITTPRGVYDFEQSDSRKLRYNQDLAQRASKNTMTKAAEEPYIDPVTGKSMRLYKTIDPAKLNEMTPQLFSYDYRDTDPIDEQIGSTIIVDDLGRDRIGFPVQFLRKWRSLNPGEALDALGMKGVLQFKQADVTFQMRVCISHIIAENGKYDMMSRPGGVHPSHMISPGWNSFDIDFPLPFRVMADLDADEQVWLPQIQRYYQATTASQVRSALLGSEYYPHTPKIMM